MQTKRIVRQDTLPADDPSWSNPTRLPGEPAPIPPRNEKSIYIPRETVRSNPRPASDASDESARQRTLVSQPEVSSISEIPGARITHPYR